MRLLLLASVLICVTACRAPRKIVLNTYQKNETAKAYKEILIAGEGGPQQKMYLQNLTEELSKQLAKRNIQIRYIYLGDYNQRDTDKVFKRVKAEEYEVLLRIMPATRTRSKNEIINEKTYDYYDRKNVNDFYLTLEEKTDILIWKGRLKTEINSAGNNYKSIGDEIIVVLTENLIIPAGK